MQRGVKRGTLPALHAGVTGMTPSIFLTLAAATQAASPFTVTRLDCGSEPEPVRVASFSDTYAWQDLKLPFTYSCYLVRHGNDYMVWDTGHAVGSGPQAPKTSLVDLLRQLNVKPDQVKYVGVSHYHDDHIGQTAQFPGATLLIGKGDWDVLTSRTLPQGMSREDFEARRARLAPWISGGGKVEPLARDKKDVFGDGTVTMLSMPGHTPGHHSLLVRLAQTGNVLLSGDVTHFRENYEVNGVPTWNSNRAESLASLDRFKQIAGNLKATVIIQHDPRDLEKLPAFPAAAK
jgi:N-acyl homoserine lactone hydrolase